MRSTFLFLLLFVVNLGFSQFENPKKSIRIGAVKSPKAPPKQVDVDTAQAAIKYESTIGKNNDERLLKNFSIAPKVGLKTPSNVELRNPSEIFTEKMNKKGSDGEILERYRSDSFLGEFRTGSKIVKIACRDHEYPDGDLVRIWLNGQIAINRILLEADFREVYLDLENGINKVEIEALNQGESGPNTAQFIVTDDSGKVVTNNSWNLTTGVKAKLIITKIETIQK
ncbi:MAG: hypothetical protein J0L86_10705 [Flavobacteriales bacterium]|nr:hypothetical protein [Flavobacteriales bacterium]